MMAAWGLAYLFTYSCRMYSHMSMSGIILCISGVQAQCGIVPGTRRAMLGAAVLGSVAYERKRCTGVASVAATRPDVHFLSRCSCRPFSSRFPLVCSTRWQQTPTPAACGDIVLAIGSSDAAGWHLTCTLT